MPSVVQVSAGEILIAGGGRRDGGIYLFNVAKRTLTKTLNKRLASVETDFMPTVLTASYPRMVVTIEANDQRIIHFSPWEPLTVDQ